MRKKGNVLATIDRGGPMPPPSRGPSGFDRSPVSEKRMNGGKSVVTFLLFASVLVIGLVILVYPVVTSITDGIDAGTQIKQDRWSLRRSAYAAEQERRQSMLTDVSEVLGWSVSTSVAVMFGGVALFVLAFALRALRLASQSRTIQPLPDQATLVGGRWVVDGRSSYQHRLDAHHEPSRDHGRAIGDGRKQRAIPAEMVPNGRGRQR